VWKAHNIGSGKLVAWDNLDKDVKLLPYELKITESGSQGSNACVGQDNSCTTVETPGPTQPQSSIEDSGVEDSQVILVYLAALDRGVLSSTSQWASLKSMSLQRNTLFKTSLNLSVIE